MTNKQDFNKVLEGFGGRLKSEPVTPALQKVTPIPAEEPKGHQLNVWISEDLAMRAKILAAKEKIKLKELVSLALEEYLAKHK